MSYKDLRYSCLFQKVVKISVEMILLLIGCIPLSSIHNNKARDIRRTLIKLETEKENNTIDKDREEDDTLDGSHKNARSNDTIRKRMKSKEWKEAVFKIAFQDSGMNCPDKTT